MYGLNAASVLIRGSTGCLRAWTGAPARPDAHSNAAHVGGNPNNVQKALIERAARLTLYVELMDAQALVEGTMTERNSRQYLAWVNALRLCLR
jgi:hypothetical protein